MQLIGLITHGQVDEKSNVFMKVIQHTISKFRKKVKVKPQKNHLPWLNSHIWPLMKQREHALKSALRAKGVHDIQISTSLRNEVTKEKKNAKAAFFLSM